MFALREFALSEYKTKDVEHHPYRLLFDPQNGFSQALHLLRLYVPSLEFQQLGDLIQLRKNAMTLIILLGVFLGMIVQKIVSRR